MFSAGVHHPRRSALISAGVTLAAWVSVGWGAWEMGEQGQDALGPGLMVGLGLLPAILGPFLVLNFLVGIKVFKAIRRGEKEIARWTVSAAELAAFAAEDRARDALGGANFNDWTPPRAPPAAGLDIIFTPDSVLIGDTYFALVTTGAFKISHPHRIAGAPPAVAFRSVTTWANRFNIRQTAGTLRIPVAGAAGAEAARVLDHFQRVDAREVIVNPDFYRKRARIGLIGAPIFFAVAAVGMGLKWAGTYRDIDDIPSLMIGVGLVFGIAMVVVAVVAKALGRAQMGRR